MSKYLKEIISHMTSNPEAIDLAHIGAVSYSVLTLIAIWCGLGGVLIIIMLLFGSLIGGICTEIVRRIQRSRDKESGIWLGFNGPNQNTTRMSILDVIITWWFLVTYYQLLKK